jgi:hypothetical protein
LFVPKLGKWFFVMHRRSFYENFSNLKYFIRSNANFNKKHFFIFKPISKQVKLHLWFHFSKKEFSNDYFFGYFTFSEVLKARKWWQLGFQFIIIGALLIAIRFAQYNEPRYKKLLMKNGSKIHIPLNRE